MYEYIIIGGGISGLYCAYKILKKNPKTNLVVLEQGDYLGGRVYTISEPWMTVEAGAGRFSKSHIRINKLIRELGLSHNIVPNGNQLDIYDVKKGKLENGEDILRNLIDYVIAQSRTKRLQNISFIDFAKEILDKKHVKYILDFFGYYSELVIMNASDCIHLMKQLSSENQFYGLKGGLSQIIDKMRDFIINHPGATILTEHSVSGIKELSPGFQVYGKILRGVGRFYIHANKCICALPSNIIVDWKIFRPIRDSIQGIKCAPLCRIYSVFPIAKNATNVWFAGMSKFHVNNPLKMVIPIDESRGIIMISYTDNKYAQFWRQLKNTRGIRGVNMAIRTYIQEALGIKIPYPKHTTVCYWECGVGYWGIGTNSKNCQDAILHYGNERGLYVCGEHYSSDNQQWMEGALETAESSVGNSGK